MRAFFLCLTLALTYATFVYAKYLGCRESLPYTTFGKIAVMFKVKASCTVNALGETIVVVTDGKDTYKHNLKKNREVE